MKKLIMIIASAIAVFASCSRMERGIFTDADDLRVTFTGSVGQYTLKAGDAGFDNGDAIGITALNPINADNVKYVYRDGALVPVGDGISWLPGQKTQTMFYAVYPYRENFHIYNDGTFGDVADYPDGHLIEVEADQSSFAGYSASNQMYGFTEAAPGKTVNLTFRRAVAKVVISVDNKLGVEITEAYLAGVYGRYLRYSGVNDGTLGTIKANPDGANSWKLVTVPQGNVRPTIVLKTADGKEYAFDCISGSLAFSAGRQYTLALVLDENVSSNFSSEVQDWSEDKEYQFDHDTYMKKKQSEAILQELAGDYTVSSSVYASPNSEWTMTIIPSGSRIGFYNLFANANWADESTMFYGDLSDDLSSILIPCGQTSEYTYRGIPITLCWLTYDASLPEDEQEAVGTDGYIVARIYRDGDGKIYGLNFGDRGVYAVIEDMGYVGIAYPTITAVKVYQ